jgi:hypothetical protein
MASSREVCEGSRDFGPGFLAGDFGPGFSPRVSSRGCRACGRAAEGAAGRRFEGPFLGPLRGPFSSPFLGPFCGPSTAGRGPPCGQRWGRPAGRVSPARGGHWARLFLGRLAPDAVALKAEALPALRGAARWRRPWPLLGAGLAAVGVCLVGGRARPACRDQQWPGFAARRRGRAGAGR